MAGTSPAMTSRSKTDRDIRSAPRRDLGAVALLFAEALELGLLDVRVIIDEGVAEAGAQAGVGAQRRQRLAEMASAAARADAS